MKKISKMLYPTDFSANTTETFQLALKFARLHNARLDVLHVAPTFGDDPLRNAFSVSINEKMFYSTLIEEMDQKMVELEKRVDAGGVRIRRIHSRGNSPASVILEYSRDQHIDLIVMGTHGHRGVKKFLLGSTALEVVRNAPCDVLTLNHHAVAAAHQAANPSILVPIDLSDKSGSLLSNAVELAKKLKYDVRLLHILEITVVPAWGLNAEDLFQLLPSREEEAKKSLNLLMGAFRDKSVSISAGTRIGHASDEIINTANEIQCGLIVVMPNAMNWLERIPLGSVTEHVMAKAPCPVYIMPASNHIDWPPAAEKFSKPEKAHAL